MEPLDILSEIATTARLLRAEEGDCILTLPQGHVLRASTTDMPDVLQITSARVRLLRMPNGPVALSTIEACLACLPARNIAWSEDVQVRWTEIQALLHDHVQRPALLARMLTSVCMEHTPVQDATVWLHVRRLSDVIFGIRLDGAFLPFSDRVAPLIAQTVQLSHNADRIVVHEDSQIEVNLPPTGHERLRWRDTYGPALDQIARLEAAWLPQKTLSPRG